MNEIKLLTPTNHIEAIGNLRFKTHKVLRDSAKAFDSAQYALHRCYMGKYTTDDEWTPLYSQLMGSIAGNNTQWALVKNTLIDSGYLECDNVCKRNTKSFCFRLGPQLKDAEWALSTEEFWIPEDTRSKMEWLTIDKDRAHIIIDEIAAEKNWDPRVTKGWHTRISNFSPCYKICKTGRAFSDANQFPARVRNTLLIDGEPTAEIDIVNCQPLLLSTIYPTRSEEWKRYKTLAENGDVYPALAKFANLNRSEAKEQFIPFIFGGSRPIAEDFFREDFPELLTAIQEIRQRWYKALVFDLQKKESEIIVERVCKEFKAVSIHDGVRVRVEDVDAVKAFITSIFLELWELTPKLTVEFSNPIDESKAA